MHPLKLLNMTSFKTTIAGFTVTNENYVSVAKEIANKYGVCPALNSLIMAVVSHDETIVHSRKGLKNAIDKYTKEIGYTPAYFANCMRKIGPEY